MLNELSLREIQIAGLDVLLKFQSICNEHNWKFFLTYGTLLGAVRHEGFIPWDDDIDVWMPRKDYQEFLDYYSSHEQEFQHFKLFHANFVKNYPYAIARFSDIRYFIEYFGIKDYGLGIFIDIYPLDEIDPTDVKLKNTQLNRIKDLSRLTTKGKSSLKNSIKKVIKPYLLAKNCVISVNELIKKIDIDAQKYNGTNQEYIDVVCWEYRGEPYLKKKMLEDCIFVTFEGYKMPAPKDYKNILTANYGDYMQLPPSEKQIAHHFYKAYRK